MHDVINIVVSERQWEELKTLMGTVNQAPIAFGKDLYAPMTCMLAALRLERVGAENTYHVQLYVSNAPEIGGSEPLLLSRWPHWLEGCVVDHSAPGKTLGPTPSAAIARLVM